MGSDQAATPNHQAGLESPEYCIPAGMVQGQFKAMGTTITTLLPAERADAIEIVRSLVAGWEQVLSRLLPESELSWLNAHPDQNIITSPLFYNVLTTVLNAAQATRGIYDPTLHDQIVKIGYDRSFDKLSSALPASTYDVLPCRAGLAWYRGVAALAQRSHGGFWHCTQALDTRRRGASPSARPAHWLARRQ